MILYFKFAFKFNYKTTIKVSQLSTNKSIFFKFQQHMYMHQALPKDIYVPNSRKYQIKNKKSSPNTKVHSPTVLQTGNSSSIIKYSSSQKAHIHHISSKQKPYLYSRDPSPSRPAILSKKYSIISDKSKKKSVKGQMNNSLHPIKDRFINKFDENQVIICKMQNKVIHNVEKPFQFVDLSLIDPFYIKSYDGQCKHNGIRHGFGIQHYSNGQKFVGFFQENMANGQGTYYRIDKTILGIWQNNKLKQIIVEI